MNYDKTKETNAHILIPQERSMHLDLRHERIVGGGCPLLRDQIDPPPLKWRFPVYIRS